ncbi:MAG: cobalamin-dependent protein [Chrysiogenetes bacterium]|nr:cobalamin-dependent protein [Chrysiogenetes bacterium]
MKIALINPPSNYSDPYPWVEPLGICYIAGACEQVGHEVLIRDLSYSTPEDLDALFRDLDEFRPDLLGMTAMTENFANGLRLARSIKSRYGCTVIFGGWHVSGNPAAVEDPVIDYAVCGEGEDTVLELLDHLQTGSPPLEEIEGIAWNSSAGVQATPKRKRIRKLERLPRPVRTGLPLDRYKYLMLNSQPISRMRTLSIQASRGCPYTCVFCQTPAVWSNIWSKRTPASVVDEIQELVDNHQINTFVFRDEEFTVRGSWVMEICDELVARGLNKKLTWGAFARVDDASEELVASMARAGCTYVLMGVEASNDTERDQTKKYYKNSEAEEAFRLYRKYGVFAQGSWIVGFPWDTIESLDAAFEWLLTLQMDSLAICFATPFHSTELYDYVEKHDLFLTRDPEHFTLHEPVIRTPHIPLETLKTLPIGYRRRFYLRPRHLAHVAGTMLRHPSRIRIVAELAYDRIIAARLLSTISPDARRTAGQFEVPERYARPLSAGPAPMPREVAV